MVRALARTDTLLAVARHVVWFKPPAEALEDPIHFLCHVMTFGDPADVIAVRQAVGEAGLREALAEAPAGVFDPRSWAYWQLILNDEAPPPPLPVRSLGEPAQPI